MRFQTLQSRLIAHIQEQVRSGELTERGLARLTGISQPHIHHVLKGVRVLSPELADQILDRLQISVLDLVDPAEWRSRVRHAQPQSQRYSEVPLLEGRIGPGYPMPKREQAHERYPFLGTQVQALVNPVAARLAADPELSDMFGEGDVVLLDRSEPRRAQPDSNRYYVVEKGGTGLVRRVHRGPSHLELISAAPGDSADAISLCDRGLLEIIKGRVVWIGRQLEPLPDGKG